MFNVRYIEILNSFAHYRRKILALWTIFISAIFTMEIVISPIYGIYSGRQLRASLAFPFPEVCEKGELQKKAARAKGRRRKERADEDRQISSLLRHDLISARRRPLKTALRNPLLPRSYHSHPSVSLPAPSQPFTQFLRRNYDVQTSV